MMRKAEEIWDVDGRKGKLTIQLREDVSEETDFFRATVVSGVPQYIGGARNFPEAVGDPITMRSCLVVWLRKHKVATADAE